MAKRKPFEKTQLLIDEEAAEDAELRRSMPSGLARALAERKANADSESLLTDLIEVWGGTRQLAMDVHAEFVKAPSGGMTRQRILEMIQRLILTNTTHDIGKTIRPADMDDDELERLALTYVRKVSRHAEVPETIPDPPRRGVAQPETEESEDSQEW